jgi:helix-turn-helix protein
MSARHPNARRIKIHRPYTVEELALALAVHKHTVRRWTKSGLVPIDDRRPLMFRGIDVVEFLQKRRVGAKQPCGPGQMYCFKCRSPQNPAGSIADLEVVGTSAGRLVGICSICGTMMYRRVNPIRIAEVQGNLEVTHR